jgi:Phospholipid methyltransferase
MMFLEDPFLFLGFYHYVCVIGSNPGSKRQQSGEAPVIRVNRRHNLRLGTIYPCPAFSASTTIRERRMALARRWRNLCPWLNFCIPSLTTIKPFTGPDEKIELKTNGFYGVVRNPIYLGEVLWCFGWSIIFRSIIGLALVPFWWAGLLGHIMIEEQSLERERGRPYLEYKDRVRGRMTPGLPI